jgi:hypothetical protein
MVFVFIINEILEICQEALMVLKHCVIGGGMGSIAHPTDRRSSRRMGNAAHPSGYSGLVLI